MLFTIENRNTCYAGIFTGEIFHIYKYCSIKPLISNFKVSEHFCQTVLTYCVLLCFFSQQNTRKLRNAVQIYSINIQNDILDSGHRHTLTKNHKNTLWGDCCIARPCYVLTRVTTTNKYNVYTGVFQVQSTQETGGGLSPGGAPSPGDSPISSRTVLTVQDDKSGKFSGYKLKTTLNSGTITHSIPPTFEVEQPISFTCVFSLMFMCLQP